MEHLVSYTIKKKSLLCHLQTFFISASHMTVMYDIMASLKLD